MLTPTASSSQLTSRWARRRVTAVPPPVLGSLLPPRAVAVANPCSFPDLQSLGTLSRGSVASGLFATPRSAADQAPLSKGILPARTLEWAATPSSRRIFPTQGSNSGLPHCRRILYPLSHQGSIPECCRLAKYPAFPWGATSAPSRGPARGQAKEGGGTCASTASPRSRGLPPLNLASDRRGLPPPLVPRRQVDIQLSPPPATPRAPTRALSPRRPNLAPGNPGRCSFRQLSGRAGGAVRWP